jgi:hypothetical protein
VLESSAKVSATATMAFMQIGFRSARRILGSRGGSRYTQQRVCGPLRPGETWLGELRIASASYCAHHRMQFSLRALRRSFA